MVIPLSLLLLLLLLLFKEERTSRELLLLLLLVLLLDKEADVKEAGGILLEEDVLERGAGASSEGDEMDPLTHPPFNVPFKLPESQ